MQTAVFQYDSVCVVTFSAAPAFVIPRLLIFYKSSTIELVQHIEDMTHTKPLFIWLPYAACILTTAYTVLVLLRVCLFKPLEA